MRVLRTHGLALALATVLGGEPQCAVEPIMPGGPAAASATFDAPLAAVRHAVRNAVLAAGGEIERDTEDVLEAIRDPDRVTALHGLKGRERIHVDYRKAGEAVDVRIETRHKDHPKKLKLDRTWSQPVLDLAICLGKLLSPVDPRRSPAGVVAAGRLVAMPVGRLAEGLAVPVQFREFLYSTAIRPGRKLTLETADEVVVDGAVVIAKGALVMAHAAEVTDPAWFGRGARVSVVLESVTAVDGSRLALSAGPAMSQGRGRREWIPAAALLGLRGMAATGSAAAILAGQRIQASLRERE